MNNPEINGILKKSEPLRSSEEKQKLDLFTTNLESQVN